MEDLAYKELNLQQLLLPYIISFYVNESADNICQLNEKLFVEMNNQLWFQLGRSLISLTFVQQAHPHDELQEDELQEDDGQ